MKNSNSETRQEKPQKKYNFPDPEKQNIKGCLLGLFGASVILGPLLGFSMYYDNYYIFGIGMVFIFLVPVVISVIVALSMAIFSIQKNPSQLTDAIKAQKREHRRKIREKKMHPIDKARKNDLNDW